MLNKKSMIDENNFEFYFDSIENTRNVKFLKKIVEKISMKNDFDVQNQNDQTYVLQ